MSPKNITVCETDNLPPTYVKISIKMSELDDDNIELVVVSI